jgi:hypothetical protein
MNVMIIGMNISHLRCCKNEKRRDGVSILIGMRGWMNDCWVQWYAMVCDGMQWYAMVCDGMRWYAMSRDLMQCRVTDRNGRVT